MGKADGCIILLSSPLSGRRICWHKLWLLLIPVVPEKYGTVLTDLMWDNFRNMIGGFSQLPFPSDYRSLVVVGGENKHNYSLMLDGMGVWVYALWGPWCSELLADVSLPNYITSSGYVWNGHLAASQRWLKYCQGWKCSIPQRWLWRN